jgi:hypothetical protein
VQLKLRAPLEATLKSRPASIALFACDAQEITEWLAWFGVTAESSIQVGGDDGTAEMTIKM